MTDLSKLSDAELQAMYGGTGAAKPVSEMSDDELKAAHGQRSLMGVLTGSDGGERYQTWPERAVRGILNSAISGATLPGDVAAGRASPNDTGRVLDLATLATPISPGGKALPLPVKKSAEVPSATELVETGGKQFEQFRNSGVVYSPQSVADLSRQVQQELLNKGIHPVDAPATYAKLKELENAPPGAFVTPANLHSLRQSLQATAQNFNPQAARDQLAASRGISALDAYIKSPPQGSVMAGSPAAASAPFEAGRGNYAAAQRSNDVTGELDRARTGILERAEARAQAANSGRNIDNTIRSKVESALEKPKEVSGLSDAEFAALDRVVQGGAGRNSARYIGNLLGGGGGMGQAIISGGGAAGGFMAGGPAGGVIGATAPPLVGAASKSIANALARRDLGNADEMLRMRSPLYQERLANPQNMTMSPETRAAIARLLLMQQMGQPIQ